MKTANLGDYLFYDGALVKVIAINPGKKAIVMESLADELCPHCNKSLGKKQIEIIEDSPLFQDNAKPIQTITDGTEKVAPSPNHQITELSN